MANEVKIPIPARVYNAAENGHVAGVEDIYDDTKGKTQKQINEELGTVITNAEMDEVLDGNPPVYLVDANNHAVLDEHGNPIEII